MKPEDLQPPEEDLTDGLPRKSTEPSTTPYESVVPVSLSALEIDIVSCLLFQSYLKIWNIYSWCTSSQWPKSCITRCVHPFVYTWSTARMPCGEITFTCYNQYCGLLTRCWSMHTSNQINFTKKVRVKDRLNKKVWHGMKLLERMGIVKIGWLEIEKFNMMNGTLG